MQIEDPIRIGDKEYKYDDLTPDAQDCVAHIVSLDSRLNQAQDHMDELQMCRLAYVNRLNSVMEKQDAESETAPSGGTGIPEQPAASA